MSRAAEHLRAAKEKHAAARHRLQEATEAHRASERAYLAALVAVHGALNELFDARTEIREHANAEVDSWSEQ